MSWMSLWTDWGGVSWMGKGMKGWTEEVERVRRWVRVIGGYMMLCQRGEAMLGL